MDALKNYVAKKAANIAVEALLSQKEQLKKSFEEMLDKNDLPIPDNIEAPLDDLISAAFDEAIDALCNSLKTLL